MRADETITRWLKPLTGFMHAKRQRALLDVTAATLRGRRLWLTTLGRNLRGPAKCKHRIKRVDRLLGNPRLWLECEEVYKRLAQAVVGRARRLVVIVDWTFVNDTEAALVASVPHVGRAQIVYAQVHPQSAIGKRRVQRIFLTSLLRVLPEGRQVFVVTDAGFSRPWFEDVRASGMHFVGRLTKNLCIRINADSPFVRVGSLFRNATVGARSLGRCQVTACSPTEAILVTQRKRNADRHHSPFRRRGLHSGSVLHRCYRRRTHEPWVLATSAHELNATCVSRIYQNRMRCEETFRDSKNLRFGLGLGHISVRQPQRVGVLLLLAALPCGWRPCSVASQNMPASPGRSRPTPFAAEESFRSPFLV